MKVSSIERQYSHFSKAVKEVLEEAYNYGTVIIVTLGERKRVKNILEHLWPEFGELLYKCTFIYAREHMTQTMTQTAAELHSTSAKLEKLGVDAPEADVDVFLENWADLWTGVKKEAILSFLRQHEGRDWVNVLSIGDSVFERDATILACDEFNAGRLHDENKAAAQVKTLKMLENPNLATLGLQLRLLKLWMPYMVCQDCDRNLEFDYMLHLNEYLSSGEKVPFLGGQAPPKYTPGQGWSAEKRQSKVSLSWFTTSPEEEAPIGA